MKVPIMITTAVFDTKPYDREPLQHAAAKGSIDWRPVIGALGVAALFYRYVESPAASTRIGATLAWPVKRLLSRQAG